MLPMYMWLLLLHSKFDGAESVGPNWALTEQLSMSQLKSYLVTAAGVQAKQVADQPH